nr:MAG TPA: hypothetical protein [Caudoviricetes sp.]
MISTEAQGWKTNKSRTEMTQHFLTAKKTIRRK